VNAEGDSTIDSTVNAIKENMPKDFNLHYFRIQKGGRAAARNYGMRQSAGNILIFYASDFIATHRLLEHHLTLHEQNSGSEVSGALFGTRLLPNNTGIPPEFFYGANTSIQKVFLNSVGPFDEVFPYDSVDDFEMGRRLLERGMKNVFLPGALAYHDHQISMEERRKAMREAGESTAIWDSKNPRLVTRDRWHRWYRWHGCIAGMVRLLTSWYRAKSSLLENEQDLWKYFSWSMTQAWVDGYRRTEKYQRT
jgi:GT2 family glycosyltransferase